MWGVNPKYQGKINLFMWTTNVSLAVVFSNFLRLYNVSNRLWKLYSYEGQHALLEGSFL